MTDRNKNYYKSTTFTFEPKAPPSSVEAALDWLKSPETKKKIAADPDRSRFHSLGNFSLFLEGVPVSTVTNSTCHASLSDKYALISSDVVAFWCDTSSFTEHHRFLDYLRYRSFATEFILASCEEGIVVSSDIPANMMHAIAMFSRVARHWEEEYFTRFNKLVDNGIPEDVAYLVTFCIKKGPFSGPFSGSYDHRMIQCPSIAGLRDFLNGKFTGVLEKEMYRNSRSSYCSCFIEKTPSLVSDLLSIPEFKKLLMEYRTGRKDGESYRPPNPFIKGSVIRQGEMSIKEVYELGLPYIIEKGLLND